MRYGIAMAVAVLLIGAGMVYVRQVDRSIDERIRQTLREAKASGTLPPGIDPEQPVLPAFGVDLPDSDVRRVKIANALVAWRLVLIPMVLLGSLGIARMFKRKSPRARPDVTAAPDPIEGRPDGPGG